MVAARVLFEITKSETAQENSALPRHEVSIPVQSQRDNTFATAPYYVYDDACCEIISRQGVLLMIWCLITFTTCHNRFESKQSYKEKLW